MTDKMKEIIVTAPREYVFDNEDLAFQGVISNEYIVGLILSSIDLSYKSSIRGEAEEDPTLKQPIPYTIVRRGDEVFLYERLNSGGEDRLHNKLSIGVGGHMNPLDNQCLSSLSEVLLENAKRELEEELSFSGNNFDIKQIGLINDDSNSVGNVHIGILNVIDVSLETEVSVKETDQLSGEWVSADLLTKDEVFNRLENWSQMAAELLNNGGL